MTTADPGYGHEGDVGLQVTITGSGFVNGAQASWQRNGVVDPKIHVVSTTFVSSTQLVATIDVASDAALDLYDLAVENPDKKKGIGYLLFEVTQAIPIAGTEIAYGATDAGEATGRAGVPGVFYFSPLTGLDTLGSPGRGFDIAADGRTIVGGTTVTAPNDTAYIYTFDGSRWAYAALPKNPAMLKTRAGSVASDPATGAATLIGGWESPGPKGTNPNRRPQLFVPTAGGWSRVDLAFAGSDDYVTDVSPTGIAVGSSNGRAAIWAPNGSGGWTGPAFIGAAGSELRGVNTPATVAVGSTSAGATYWVNNGGVWSGPMLLPGACSSAEAIDDSGRIVANGCPKGARRVPGVIAPPYTASNVTLLGGFGDNANTTIAENISRGGTLIVGQSTVHNQPVGAYWRTP